MSGFVRPGFTAATVFLCAVVFCAEYSNGFLQGGFDALRTANRKTTCSGETCTTSKKGGGTTSVVYAEDTVVPSNFDVQAELMSAGFDNAAGPLLEFSATIAPPAGSGMTIRLAMRASPEVAPPAVLRQRLGKRRLRPTLPFGPAAHLRAGRG